MKVQSLIIATLAVFALSTAASAADQCRRFIPSAGVTVEVPCETEPATKVPAEKVEKKVTPAKERAPVKQAASAKKIVTAEATIKPAKVAGARDAQVCGAILDRAERGAVTSDERRTLRTDCRK